jgi:hypothetical protein
MLSVLHVSLGVLIALALAGLLIYWYIQDITQKKHAVLRNFPIIGHLRYFFENLGEYFRQYFFLGDRDEMPFNRATRAWVYRLAKNEGGILGFGSTYNIHEAGALIFVNAPFPVQEDERQPTPPLLIGEGFCDKPMVGRSLVNISGMSFGAISKPAVRALSHGAAKAGCWMDTGEGGLSPYHLEGGCDIIFQIGHRQVRRARRYRRTLSPEKLREVAAHEKRARLRDQAVAGGQTGQGRGAARRQGDRGNRPHPRHSHGGRIRCRRTATATLPTCASCSTWSSACATSPASRSVSRPPSAAGIS